jgi:CHAD domain-containing protein
MTIAIREPGPAGDQRPAAVAADGAVALDPAMPAEEALRRIGLAYLDQIRQNETAVLAGSAEGVHRMRVAVRRLRAVLSAFGRMLPQAERHRASQELRWLAGALGAARNLDVFAHALVAPARRALGERDGLAALGEAVAQRRSAAYGAAAEAIGSPRYGTLLGSLAHWFETAAWREGACERRLAQPIGGVAAEILERRRRAAKRRGRHFAAQSAAERHRLRIALKKWRYAGEGLAGLYAPRAVGRFTRRLKRLQDELGEANDLRVGHDIVAELAQPNGAAAAIAAAGQAVLAWHGHRLARREPKLKKHLRRLFAAEPFWRG